MSGRWPDLNDLFWFSLRLKLSFTLIELKLLVRSILFTLSFLFYAFGIILCLGLLPTKLLEKACACVFKLLADITEQDRQVNTQVNAYHTDKEATIDCISGAYVRFGVCERHHQVECENCDYLVESLDIESKVRVHGLEPPHVSDKRLRNRHHYGDLAPDEILMEDQNIGEAQSAQEKNQWEDNQRPFCVLLTEINTSQKLTIPLLKFVIIPKCDVEQEEETGKDREAYYDS